MICPVNKLLVLWLMLWVALATAAAPPIESAPSPADPAPVAAAPAPELPAPASVTTEHTVTIDGQTVRYAATAGTLVLPTEEVGGEPAASLFFVAYTRLPNHAAPPALGRPVAFVFNGGPGAAAVWLHMGTLGPRRVRLQPNGEPLPPPYGWEANQFSILDSCDLVFIDPVSTGFSRAASPEQAQNFHGVEPDIRAVGRFIERYCSDNQRWLSPKFLIGESYGSLRAAGLAHHLQAEYGMYLNGVILISTVLEFQTLDFATGNDLPYVLALPSYAAAAHFHGKLSPELQAQPLRDLLTDVETFARDTYAPALLQGARLPEDARQNIAAALARYCGLSTAYVLASNLRIPVWRYAKELLRDQRRTVGRMDARFTGIDPDAAGDSFSYDPSLLQVKGVFATVFNSYVRHELGFTSPFAYEVLAGSRSITWNYEPYQNRYVQKLDELRHAMAVNPHLVVLVAGSYYDLATPYYAAEYSLAHLSYDKAILSRVKFTHYASGHMMYLDQRQLAALNHDLRQFISTALPPPANPQ